MVTYRLIGKGTTDSNGVAHMTKATSDGGSTWTDTTGYTGVGAGELDVVASTDNPMSASSCQSEPYTVWDYIVYDTGKTGRDTTKWTNSNMAVFTDENGTTLTRTGTGTGSYTSNVVMTGDFEAILQLKTNGTSVRVGIVDASQSNLVSHAIRTNTGESYFKLTRVNGVLTAQESGNGTTWTNVGLESNNVGSNDCKFTFFIIGSNERSVTFHDLTILPL